MFHFCLNLFVKNHDAGSCGGSGIFFVSFAISFEGLSGMILAGGLLFVRDGIEGFFKIGEVFFDFGLEDRVMTLKVRFS